VKKSNSGLIHPRVILGWPKFFWDILFSVKYVYKFLWESAQWFWRYSHVYLWQTDRQTDRLTDECRTTIYVWVRLFTSLKNYLPYSLRKFRFAHLLRSQGDKCINCPVRKTTIKILAFPFKMVYLKNCKLTQRQQK